MIVSRIKKRVKDADRRHLGGRLVGVYRVLRYGMPEPLMDEEATSIDRLAMIGFDISGTCNLECTMCSLKDRNPPIHNRVIPMEAIDRIASVLPTIRDVSLQINCEPLINRDADKFVSELKSRKPDLFVSMTTNATLMTESLCENLIQAGINKIVVSLDGATAETFEAIRVGANFEKVVENIRMIARLRDRIQPQAFELGTIAVSSKDNLHELQDILQLSFELGADEFIINGLEPYDAENEKIILYGRKPIHEIEKHFRRLRDRADQLGIKIVMPSLVKHSYSTCNINSCIIDADGYVFPCSVLSYERKYYYEGTVKIHPAIEFGNIFQKDLKDIWDSEAFTRFRTNVREGHLPGYCKNCLMQEHVICG